jgi:glutathione S-transferase
MILYGRYRSPFTRRVAISLRLLGMEYEHRPLTAWTHLDDVRAVNPVGRIPALQLDSGEVLFDSGAILDYLDQIAGPERGLVPPREPERHEVLKVAACAMGALEKIVAALYEQTMHPPEKIHLPWIRHNEDQATSALAWLGAHYISPAVPRDKITQAEVTTVAMFDFARIVNPQLVREGRYANLDALIAHCDAFPEFAATLPVGEADKANPALPGSGQEGS